jgi:hypothetical protein
LASDSARQGMGPHLNYSFMEDNLRPEVVPKIRTGG